MLLSGVVEDPLISDTLELEEALVHEEDGNWTIQVIYPEDGQADSILSQQLVSLEAVPDTILEESINVTKQDSVSVYNQTAESGKSRKHKTDLPFANCWTPNGYACPNCKKIYNARKNLARHINLECGKEPQYSCPYCDYRNYRRNEIKKHAKNKHHLIFT